MRICFLDKSVRGKYKIIKASIHISFIVLVIAFLILLGNETNLFIYLVVNATVKAVMKYVSSWVDTWGRIRRVEINSAFHLAWLKVVSQCTYTCKIMAALAEPWDEVSNDHFFSLLYLHIWPIDRFATSLFTSHDHTHHLSFFVAVHFSTFLHPHSTPSLPINQSDSAVEACMCVWSNRNSTIRISWKNKSLKIKLQKPIHESFMTFSWISAIYPRNTIYDLISSAWYCLARFLYLILKVYS